MKDTLKVGDRSRLEFTVPAGKTVPNLYPESPDFQAMPAVFATGFMVGLMEWGCLELLKSHLDAGEGSLGIHVNVSHSAATVPGQVVSVDCECTAVNGRRISFKVTAHDGVEVIGAGTHDRMVVPWKRFVGLVNAKAAKAGAAEIAMPGAGS
jgi:fluoroacetyl-CoA thioesterase